MRPFLIIIYLLSAPVFAQSFQDGVEALQSGDYRAAFAIFKTGAEQGDAGAQYILGVMYNNGEGVPENDAEAVRWYRKAAKQGHAGAQYFLGLFYAMGKGVPENDAEAFRWFRKAAKQGHADAQYNLGEMYAIGTGVPEDYVQAYMWANLAAAQGVDHAPELKSELRRQMTNAQIAEAQRLSSLFVAKKAMPWFLR